MQFSQIKETCLYVKSLEASLDFYHGKLNLPVISKVDDRHVFFRCGASVLLCFKNSATMAEKNLPPHYAIGKQHIALEVAADQYAACLEEFNKLGITITHKEPWHSDLESFYFEDPDGHVLEVVPSGLWG